jgi:hypothetical protein
MKKVKAKKYQGEICPPHKDVADHKKEKEGKHTKDQKGLVFRKGTRKEPKKKHSDGLPQKMY